MAFNFIAAVSISIDFGAKENDYDTVYLFSPFICHEVMANVMILAF